MPLPFDGIIATRFHSRVFPAARIALVCSAYALALAGCTKSATPPANEIRVLVESAPATMNPRHALDAIGQRLQMLSFRALTGIDANLETIPDLSKKWRFERDGRRAIFELVAETEADHAGVPFLHRRLLRCFRNYLDAGSNSPHRLAFPHVREIRLERGALVFELSAPDPYLAKNLSVLRYFGIAGDPENPCRDPAPGERVVTNGAYRIDPYPLDLDHSVRLVPLDPEAPALRFEIVREETSRILKLLAGEGDVVFNSFAPTKTVWLTRESSRGFRLIEREGVNSSYLAFNLRDPVLRLKEIRLAIAHAIDRRAFVERVLRGQASVASSFLSPALAEGIAPRDFAFDPAQSVRLLESVGYHPGADGVRLRIRYKTTTDKVGLELAQVLRGMLAKVGIALDLEPVEPSVFFASIRKGHFQMHMGRWIGVSDGSIFQRALRSTSPDNRAGFVDPVLDGWVASAGRELSLAKRKELLAKIQLRVLDELPYFPLWHWSNALVVHDRIEPLPPEAISLSGSYVTLTRLRPRKPR